MSKIIELGLEKGLISFLDDERKLIQYCNHPKPRNFYNPEEQVQAEAFIRLVTHYKYPANRIKMYETVTMGANKKEADIIVYNDDECLQPYILVECKKEEVSEAEFLQAIEQAYSYAYALPNDVKFVWVTSNIRNEYFEVDKKLGTKESQPDIPQLGVKRLASYKYVYDAASLKDKEGSQRFDDISIIEQNELTRRFKQAHDALWAGGQLNPSEAFDELDKLIFCKIWDERQDRVAGEPYDFQIHTISKDDIPNERERRNFENDSLYKRVINLYEQGRKKDAEVFRDNIRLSPEKIRTVVGYLQDVNLGDTDLDSKGRAFETFMSSYFRGNFGQYFTPRQIVDFAVDVLPITNEHYVLDTSCGSGGFLLYALNKVREQATALYPNYEKDTKQYAKWFKYWHDFAEKNLYGIEINEQISRAAKMNMIIHDDGHTNVITSDGLYNEDDIQKITDNKGFKYNHFDFIVTNPPFGSSVRLNEKAYLKTYKLGLKEKDWLTINELDKPKERDNQSTEVLFIEQGYRFLKEGGYMAIVIPDGILTNSSLQYVRDSIEEMFRIVAVVSMPQTAFAANGAGVKSSVLFLRKWSIAESDKISNLKSSIAIDILNESQYNKQVALWEKEKKDRISKLEGFVNTTDFTDKKDIIKTEEFKTWKAEISAQYTEKINSFKEELNDIYLKEKQIKLPDYSIFMAIAEDIGYDATGKPTQTNELKYIAQELKKFINSIK